jgi:ParB family transcriptional regulator, chromosome partitioning protein
MKKPATARVQSIDLALVYANPDQPRKRFDQDELAQLAGSIAENGLIQPISVIDDGAGKFMIVAGERRFRAHKLLQDRGQCDVISCIVQVLNGEQVSINAIIENDQRVDVSLMEQARSYKRMIDVYGLTPEELSRKLGKRLSKIAEVIGYNRLTEKFQQLLDQGHFCMVEANALAGLSHRGQDMLFAQIKAGRCNSVSAVKAIAQHIANAEAQVFMFALPPDAPSKGQREVARAFEAKLEAVAGMLRAGIEDNIVTAVRKVNPGRAATISDILFQMQRDLRRMESAFRIAAAQDDLAA